MATSIWPWATPALRQQRWEHRLPVDRETTIRLIVNGKPSSEQPTLVLLHGFCGDAEASYIRLSADHARRMGWATVRINVRNHGETEADTPGLFHGGMYDDAEATVNWLLEELGVRHLQIIGFSLGGNMVLRMAAAWEDRFPDGVKGITAVSPAVDLTKTSRALETCRFSPIYTQYFMRKLRKIYARKHRHFPDLFPKGGMKGLRSVRDFDEQIVAPAFGFRDAAHYYLEASALKVAHKIQVPTLLVHSRDDPFVPAEPLDDPVFKSNPHCRIRITDRGGHVAFMQKSPNERAYWCELTPWHQQS